MQKDNSSECENCTETIPIATRLREFCSNRKKYHLEWQMMGYIGVTFCILAILTTIMYFTIWSNIPDFLSKRGWWLFYLLITITFTGGAIWHLKAYRAKVSTMTGMMIGMIVGMQSGLMLSVVIGSTNGMFMGSLLGMLFGVFVGVYTGKCCGIMGILQGAMAGMMGGTMGPMISLMMKTDHLLWFMPPFMIINVLILLGMSYLLFEDVVEKNQNITKNPVDFLTFFSYSLITTAIFMFIIVYGYKSAFVA